MLKKKTSPYYLWIMLPFPDTVFDGEMSHFTFFCGSLIKLEIQVMQTLQFYAANSFYLFSFKQIYYFTLELKTLVMITRLGVMLGIFY